MINKFSNIQNTKFNIDPNGATWVQKEFAFPNRTIRLGTTFSGIGAIEHAFHRLGLNTKIQFAGDIDDECKKAYFANYEISENNWHTDVHNFSAKPYFGKIDLLVGGAPCQAFSIRGKRGGFEDTRGTLFSDFARLIMECQPKIFIFENVKGILNHDKGHTWEVIKKTFEDDCGYDVYFQVLNSKDYGIPQNRERVFCIGFKSETEFKFPAPIKLKFKMFDFLDKEIDEHYFLKQKGVNFITRTLNHNKSYTQINGDIALCQKRNQQFNWHGDFVFHPLSDTEFPDLKNELIHNIYNYEQQYYLKDGINKYVLLPPSSCVHETEFIYNGKIVSTPYIMSEADAYNHKYGRFRKLTPKECLRFMGFDDSFKIVVSDTTCYQQSGNSIVVNVLMAILKQMDITKFGI